MTMTQGCITKVAASHMTFITICLGGGGGGGGTMEGNINIFVLCRSQNGV